MIRSIKIVMFPVLILLLCCCQNVDKDNIETEDNNQPSQTEATEDTVEDEVDAPNLTGYDYDEKGFQNISFTAYVQDPDTESPTNIRQTPGGTVLVPLEQGQDYMVDIIGQNNGWFKIDMVHCIDPNNAVDIPGQYGWIHHSVLAVSTANYGNQKLNVYEHPDKATEIVGVIHTEVQVRFSKIYNNWVFITYTDKNGKKISGWIEKDWLCGNPVTNCC